MVEYQCGSSDIIQSMEAMVRVRRKRRRQEGPPLCVVCKLVGASGVLPDRLLPKEADHKEPQDEADGRPDEENEVFK